MAEYPYVVAGATIFCSEGTHFNNLDLPMSHGVYIRDRAAMHEEDSVPGINIPEFGVCRSANNSNGEKQTSDAVGLLPFDDSVSLPIVGKLCTPMTEKWIDAKEDVLVEGIPALTVECTLVCTQGGGIIAFVDDGQGV